MKRYASHYLLCPGIGYLRQFAVEIEQGYVIRIFPCMQERESVEWHPGVTLLLPEGTDAEGEDLSLFRDPVISPDQLPETESIFSGKKHKAFLLYPFDFSSMRPVGETQHTPLL